VVMTSKLPLSTSVERRFIQPFMRGKNVGDAGPRLIARPSFILFGGGATTDASAPLTSVTSRYPQDFTIFTPLVSQFTDSVQFVLRSLDRPEPSLRLLGRTPTRLPFIDDIEIYLINVDRDHDGVPDAVDGCPTVSAAGQDANGDGCTDQGATLRHVESWSESRPLHVAISANGDPRIADGSDLTEVQAGFQAWSGVPGSSLSIQFDAPTVAHDSSPLDGVNLITFEDDHFSFPPDVVAVTPTLSFTTRGSYLDEPALPGEIVDADMIFNPAFTFSTPTHNGGPGSFDLRSVVTHEAGHFLGLSHSGTLDATMFFVLQPRQDAASLEDDDRAAIAAAYPDPSLFTDFGAITGHVVRGGTVQPVPGALVTAVRLGAGNALEDSTASDYTDEDGAYALRRLPPGSYAVRITPLDGEVGGFPLTPAYISQRVQAEAVADFDAEWWDAAEGAADPPNAFEPIAVAAGTTVPGIDVVTNIDATGPAVASVTPADNAVDVHVDQAIVVDFDERIDSSSLQGNLLLHVAGAGHPSLGGSGELQLNGRRFLFAPSPTLEFGTTYELEVTSGITDRAGNTLPTPVTTRFTTESRPTVAITDLQPRSAPEGALITILGAGFDATAANQVSFTCPSCAPVVVAGTSVTPSTIVVQVPAGATTGPIQVTVGAEMSNLLTLTVLPPGNQVAPSLNGRFDLPSGFSPTDVAIAPDGLTLYAVGPGGFATINLDPGLPDLRVVRVETLGACNHLALTPDGSLAYVTRRDLGDVIAVDADPRSGRFRQPRATIPAGESGSPDGIAIAPSGQRAYVTDPFGSLIYEIDTDVRSLTRNQVRRELQDPDHALTGGVAVAPGSGTVYFTTSNAGSRSFDLGTPTSSALNDEPSAGGVVVTPSGGEVLSLGGETSAGTVLFHRSSGVPAAGSFVLGGALRDIAVGPQGKSAFVVNAAYNRLQVVDVDALSPSYHTRVAEVATGQNPSAIAVSTDGARIVIAEEGSSSVALYGTGTQGQIVRVEPSIALPGDQVSIALSSGFDATGAKVDLGAGALLVSRVSSPSPSAVALRVPSLAQSDLGLTVVGSNGNRTLAAGFRVVDAIEGLTPRTTGFVLTSSGEQCAGTPTIGALEPWHGNALASRSSTFTRSLDDLERVTGSGSRTSRFRPRRLRSRTPRGRPTIGRSGSRSGPPRSSWSMPTRRALASDRLLPSGSLPEKSRGPSPPTRWGASWWWRLPTATWCCAIPWPEARSPPSRPVRMSPRWRLRRTDATRSWAPSDAPRSWTWMAARLPPPPLTTRSAPPTT